MHIRLSQFTVASCGENCYLMPDVLYPVKEIRVGPDGRPNLIVLHTTAEAKAMLTDLDVIATAGGNADLGENIGVWFYPLEVNVQFTMIL